MSDPVGVPVGPAFVVSGPLAAGRQPPGSLRLVLAAKHPLAGPVVEYRRREEEESGAHARVYHIVHRPCRVLSPSAAQVARLLVNANAELTACGTLLILIVCVGTAAYGKLQAG